MKRSEINKIIKNTLSYFKKKNFNLPEWSEWSVKKWHKNKILAKKIHKLQLGWDITDFGGNNFKKEGLVLFSLRNGSNSNAKGIQYAEKLMLMLPGQKIPFHFHKNKKEDIINRYGGILELELYSNTKKKTKIAINIDQDKKFINSYKKIKLKCGQSAYVQPRLIHSFSSSQKNIMPLIIGEISSINDDNNDNFFPNKNIRFSKIVEDEKINIPTWKDLDKLF